MGERGERVNGMCTKIHSLQMSRNWVNEIKTTKMNKSTAEMASKSSLWPRVDTDQPKGYERKKKTCEMCAANKIGAIIIVVFNLKHDLLNAKVNSICWVFNSFFSVFALLLFRSLHNLPDFSCVIHLEYECESIEFNGYALWSALSPFAWHCSFSSNSIDRRPFEIDKWHVARSVHATSLSDPHKTL